MGVAHEAGYPNAGVLVSITQESTIHMHEQDYQVHGYSLSTPETEPEADH